MSACPNRLSVRRLRRLACVVLLGGDAIAQIPQNMALSLRIQLAEIARGVPIKFDAPHGHLVYRDFGSALFQCFKRHARCAAPQTAAGEMIVLKILDMAQNRFARIEALGAAGLLGKRVEALFDLGWQAQRQHDCLQIYDALFQHYTCIANLPLSQVGSGMH